MVVPASQAPYNALLLASRSLGLPTTRGSEELNVFIPSSAIIEMMGLPSCAYSASTQCAIAFMPLAAETAAGSPSVISRSQITVFGMTLGSRPVFFAPPSDCPQMLGTSQPQYR